MRFRVQRIQPGYCEIWANERDDQRYECIAMVTQLDNGWHWLATNFYFLPEDNYVTQSTRRGCVNECKRTALKRLVERAIKQQTKESPHWHSPRRDAWSDVKRHDYLFKHDEMEEIDKMLKAFEEEQS